MRIPISCVTCVLAAHVLLQADGSQSHSPAPAAAVIEQFLSKADVPLTSYRAFRRLEASAGSGRMHAMLTVWTSLEPDRGFEYSILEEEGSGIIRRKVLRAALEAERSLREHGELGRGALTSANYEFTAAPDAAEGLVSIHLHPRRRDRLLIEGRMVLTEDGAELIQVDGVLTKRPSVWTRQVDVARRYARIGGVRVPVSLHSTAQVLIVGASTFSMTYQYESVNGKPVEEAGSAPGNTELTPALRAGP